MDVIVILALVTVFVVLGLLLYVVWLKWRMARREAKSYERGLKMVPLLIHLPPSSDDTEVGSRDSRDVTEETISKAQVLYDIIASTSQTGFKSKLYGQRHLSFEIIAVKGLVHFYTAVPVTMVGVVQQAIISAYPTARLEEVSEHNIFSPVGKLSGTMGGELVLKEDFMNPIATFQETKRDSIQALLNSLSGLGEEDGAGIQILLRPAQHDWTQKGIDYAKAKKDGKEKKSFGGKALSFTRHAVTALSSPLEDNGGGKSGSGLTNLEQSRIDAIEDKTKHVGYEVLIRVITSSNTSGKAHTILNNIRATFALFDAPGKNGFKFSEAKDIESFVTAYIMRFFPPEINKNILNSVELATIFHFPDESSTPTSQLGRQESKQVDGPRNMPDNGLLLGYNEFRGVKKEVRLSDGDRRRHMYIVGQTGTGKSTVLENLALQDMLAGKGFAFVDPHGDAVDSLMSMVPKERTEDIIYFCPADMDYPLGLNLFEFNSPDQKDFLIQEAINMLYKLYDPQRQGIIGPRYEHWFRNAALTLMSDPGGSTFIDIPKLFTDNQYAKQKLKHVTDQTVLDFWNKEMAQTSDYHKSEVLGWFVSKFGAFLSNEMMRNIIGQTESSFDLRTVMDEGKILFVNLSKGKTGDLNSKLLGMIFIMKFQAAAMSRANIPEAERKDFSLYVDEFQNFSTDSFSTILSEARKYRLNLIVANQYISQLTDDIRDAVFGNVGSIITYRTGATDAEFLVKQFSPVFDVDDLVRVPNFKTIMRLMINNVPSQPFSMAALPPLGHQNPELLTALKRLSAAKFGKPRKVVEAAIFERLKTIAPPRPKFAQPQAGGSPFNQPKRPQVAPRPGGMKGKRPLKGTSGSVVNPEAPSFLDDWLQKRKARLASQSPQPAKKKPARKTSPKQSTKAFSSVGIKTNASSASSPPGSLKSQDEAISIQGDGNHGADFVLPRNNKGSAPAQSPANPAKKATMSSATPSKTVSPAGVKAPSDESAALSELLRAKLKNSDAAAVDAIESTNPVKDVDPDDLFIDKQGLIHYNDQEEEEQDKASGEQTKA